MNASAIGAILGLVAALGLIMVFTRLHATRRPPLAIRVAPFVFGQHSLPAPEPEASLVTALLMPGPGSQQRRSLERTMTMAGRIGDLDRFRIEQVAGGLLGAVAGGALGVVGVLRGAPVPAIIVLGGFGAVIGVLLIDRQLAQKARQRSARMGRDLPPIAELLAFAVAAGESPTAGLERVTMLVEGELAGECRAAVGEMRAGMPLDIALRGIADRSGNADVERFVDGIIVAVERGTPLVDVLRAQAADARASQRRALLESAGRKDVLMLVPVVFFILPTVVAIALFPGMRSLQLVVP